LQGIQDCLGDSLFVREKLVVPNTDDLKALRSQICIPLGVTCAFGMLAPIDLDDQFVRGTQKIYDVMSDRNLSPKLESVEAVSAN
jgi:hypothetical protein